ncbi:MAG: hypothetical protein JEY96_16985 [Bacteroidales bacterium]|nr:hypothetical protein [Bacteroidales bacterium]
MEFIKAQIKKYKDDFGGVYKYTTKDGKSCLLRSPDLNILDACRTISGGSSIKFDKALLDNCWLEGDEELRTIDKYQIGLFDWLGGIIQKVDGALEEL